MIDGHQDIAWNALEFGRDPRLSAYEVRRQEAGSDLPALLGERTTGLPEYLAGRVAIVFATIFVMPARSAYPGYNAMTYATPAQAEQRGQAELDYYVGLTAPQERFRLVASQADLEAVVNSWTQPAPGQEPLVGLVVVMEGADPLINPGKLEQWYQAGVRAIGPAWHATRYSGGTGAPGPLTDLGRQLLQEMARRNMLLDLSHISQEAYLEAVDSYPAQMMASHSNPRTFLPTDRGLSDDMMRKLIARQGVIGVNLYNRFLLPGWTEGDPRQQVPLERVGEVIDSIVQLAGDARHVAIGSDFDGGFGLSAIPAGLDTCADLLKLTEILEKRGYTKENIEDIMNGNWLRCLTNSLPK